MSMFEFKLPDLGEGVAEGEIVRWHVSPGSIVAEDQDMVEVMTDKATVTIGSPRAGTIERLAAQVGDRVSVGTVLVRIVLEAPAAAPASCATAVGDIRESLPGTGYFARQRAATPERSLTRAREKSPTLPSKTPRATPATRKLARSLGVNLRELKPASPEGRISKADVQRAAEPAVQAEHAPREVRKPFVGLRRRIAERMRLSKSQAAHFTFVEEVEVDRLSALLAQLGDAASQQGVKLHYLPFVVKAVALALKQHPLLNATLDEAKSELVYRNYYDVGIATATDEGLVVPVVRGADERSILSIAREIQRLAEGARAGKLAARELSGSTFTVSSLGKRGGLLATPVLNHPEVGILGVHRVKPRPVVRNGAIAIAQVMMVSLSFDHRIIDGHVGAAFAYDLIELLEHPEKLLLS